MSKWPKLSESLGQMFVAPYLCQGCGADERDGEILDIWCEHDDRDQPTTTVVVLCRPCGDAKIEKHPRLYSKTPRNEPRPGVMTCCGNCIHRVGITCTSLDLLHLGGTGVKVHHSIPQTMHVNAKPKHYWLTIYDQPPRCDSKEEHFGIGSENV